MAVRNHTQSYWQFINVTEGQLRYVQQGKEYVLEEGDMVLVPKGAMHRFWNDFAETVHYYQLNFTFVSKSLQQLLEVHGPYIVHDAFCNLNIANIYEEYRQQRKLKDEYASAALKTLVLHIAKGRRVSEDDVTGVIDTTGYNKLSKKVIAFLTDNFAKDLSLDEISTGVGITKNYLCNAFKQNTGTTINGCLNMIRIRKAAEMIVYSDLPLSQVSQMCGYISVSHFNRVFMRYVGIPPGQCRRAFSFDNLSNTKRSPGSFMYSVLAGKSITSDMINEFESRKREEKE